MLTSDHFVYPFTFTDPSPGFEFFEGSAKECINVKQVFDKLVDVICDKMNDGVSSDASPSPNHKEAGLKDAPRGIRGGCAC